MHCPRFEPTTLSETVRLMAGSGYIFTSIICMLKCKDPVRHNLFKYQNKIKAVNIFTDNTVHRMVPLTDKARSIWRAMHQSQERKRTENSGGFFVWLQNESRRAMRFPIFCYQKNAGPN
jgi:hypothetical protein